MLNVPETRSGLFLAKSRQAGKKAAREKFMRLFEPSIFQVNTEIVYRKDTPTAQLFIDSVDKDPDRIRGGTNHLVHWSEVAFSKLENGVTVRDILEKIVLPSQRKTGGYAYLESTMNGKNGWHDLLENHDDIGFKKIIVALSMLVSMGLVTLEEFEEIKRTTHPDIFRQEYECEAVTFQGRAYWEFSDDLIDSGIPNPEPWQRTLIAMDWGFNPSATCVIWAYVRDKELIIYDEHYMMEELPKTTAEVIKAKNAHYKVEKFAATADHDPARIEELRLRGIACRLANKANVMGNRMQIKELLYEKRIKVHPRCKNVIKDLQAAVWDSKKEGELDYDQCTWGHFDAEAAVRYLVREFSNVEAEEPETNPHLGEDGDDISAMEWEARRRKQLQRS